MGSMPSELWWIVVIGTGIVIGFLVAFVGSLIFSNRIITEEKGFSASLMETTTALLLVLDGNGVIQQINKAFAELTGFEKKNLIGKKLIDTNLYKKNKSFGKLVDNQDLQTKNLETEIIRPTGHIKYVKWNYSFFEGLAEKKDWHIWTGSDVTELVKTQTVLEKVNKTLEIRIEQATEELSSLIEQSPFAIVIFDPDGSFDRCNRVFENIICDKNFEENINSYNYLKNPFLVSDELVFDSKNIFFYGGNFISQKLHVEDDIKLFSLSPKIKWLVVRFYAVQDKDKEVFKVACLIEDVTEQKMVEEAYLDLKEQKIKSAAILSTLENERQRISLELHDGVQQLLTSAKIKLDTFEISTGTENKYIEEASDLLYKTNDEIRRIVKDLHPQEIDNFGLFHALESLISDIQSTKNISVEYEKSFANELGKYYHLPVYRIIQEGFGNILKHSEATKCYLKISGDEKFVKFELSDNGKGFDQMDEKKSRYGHGLTNMKKRAEFIGGKFSVKSNINEGTNLTLIIPLEKYGES